MNDSSLIIQLIIQFLVFSEYCSNFNNKITSFCKIVLNRICLDSGFDSIKIIGFRINLFGNCTMLVTLYFYFNSLKRFT